MLLFCPLREIRVALLVEGTAAARAALPIPTGVCSISVCPTMVWPPVRTDGDACDCTRGLYGHRKRVCTES